MSNNELVFAGDELLDKKRCAPRRTSAITPRHLSRDANRSNTFGKSFALLIVKSVIAVFMTL